MDIRRIKEIVIQYRALLIKAGIQPDVFILFGSHAKGTANKHSDIDLAVVSHKFRKGSQISIKLNRIAFQMEAPLEVIPITYSEYMKNETTSPILDEIFKTGIVLF